MSLRSKMTEEEKKAREIEVEQWFRAMHGLATIEWVTKEDVKDTNVDDIDN